jgi:hypothetical protein
MEKKRLFVGLDRGIFKIFPAKQAQVTVFIILGILLLLAFGLIYVVKTEVITFNPEELAVFQKGNVEDYLSACIQQLGEEAIFKIGQQGGYLELPPEISGDPGRNLVTSPLTKVPFWAYQDKTSIPPLSDIKIRIDNYIQDNLRNCIFQFTPFMQQYDFLEKSSITANTEIVENKVIFNVHWDIDIRNKAGERVTETIEHLAESPIKLKKAYDTAKLITEREMGELKLEDITQDLLALEHPLVPVSGFEMSCDKKEWEVMQAEVTFREMLHINLAQLQIKGTQVIEYPESLPYYQSHYLWDLGQDFQQSQISAYFQYDNYTNYPYYFSVTPRSGSKLLSNSVTGGDVASFLCMQNWKFNYDLIYPILVNVRDETTGYVFKIGMTVNLQHNYPNKQITSNFPTSTFTLPTSATYDSTEFCKNARIPLAVNTFQKVENSFNGVYFREPLEKVNVSYNCLKFSCPFGITEYDYLGKGDVSGYGTNVPYCAGAIVRGEKEGFKPDWIRIIPDGKSTVELNLIPLKKIPLTKIKILKQEFLSPQQVGAGVPLSKGEWATIKIYFDDKKMAESLPSWVLNETANDTNVTISVPPESELLTIPANYANLISKGWGGNHDHESFITLSPGVEDPELSEQTLDLLAEADYAYGVEINLFRQNGEEGALIGGYRYNWTVPWNQLAYAQEITFNVLTIPNLPEMEQLEFMNNLGQSSLYATAPKIK